MANHPRVLFVTGHLPLPALSGGRLRELELLRRVREHVDVDVVAVTKTLERDAEHLRAFRALCAEVRLFRAEDPPVRDDGVHDGVPYLVRRHACPAAGRCIARAARARRYDVVHLEGFYLSAHLAGVAGVPLVVDEQNVESSLWWQRAATEPDLRRRDWLAAEARATAAAEKAVWRRADLVTTVTDLDRGEIAARLEGAGPPVRTVEDGADHLATSLGTQRDGGPRSDARRSVIMVGNFAYPPTADAALHLVCDVLPAIRRRGCDPEVRLVGAAPPAAIRALAADPRIHVTGEVPAVEPWLDGADVVLVPLRVGGGVKVKVLEALARGRPVVTTPVGAQGLSAAAARGVTVAADAEGLAERTAALLRDPLARVISADAARRAAVTLPRWNAAAAALLACWAEAAGRGAASAWRTPALIAS